MRIIDWSSDVFSSYLFGQGAPHGVRLLHAVTAEAIGEKHVLDIGVRTDDDIVIDGVHIVVAGPAIGAPDRFERGYARGQERPEHLVEQFVLHVEIETFGVVLLFRGNAADKSFSLEPEISAAGVYDHGATGKGGRALKLEHATFACLHRQPDENGRRTGRERG